MRTIIGDVHDLNAYMLGGCSGHAGLLVELSMLQLQGTFIFNSTTMTFVQRYQGKLYKSSLHPKVLEVTHWVGIPLLEKERQHLNFGLRMEWDIWLLQDVHYG